MSIGHIPNSEEKNMKRLFGSKLRTFIVIFQFAFVICEQIFR